MKKLLDANNRVWDDETVKNHKAEMNSIMNKEIESHKQRAGER
jgi:hypothetical protein